MINRTEKLFWLFVLLIYGIPNLILFWFSLQYNLLIVDMVPVEFDLNTLYSFLCLFVLFFSFIFIARSSIFGAAKFKQQPITNGLKYLGVIVFALQFAFLGTVLYLDYGRVGGAGGSTNPIALFFSYVNVDAIFLIYYGHSRAKKVSFYNLSLFLISNTLRGWTGIWLMIALIETYYAIQRMTPSRFLKYSVFCLILGLAAYPTINQMKESTRGSELRRDEEFFESISRLVVRLQLMTSTMLIAQEAQNIEKQLNQGSVRSYYSDNKLLGLINPAQEGEVSLQKFLTQNYLIDYSVLGRDVDQDEIGWYTHTGVSGWLFILNWYSLPIYLFFVLLLTVTPYLISARFIRAPTLIPVLHVASIFYVFHGWFGVQVGFILGLITYILLLSLVRGARFKKQGSCEGNIFLVEHRISKVHPQASSAE